MKLTKTQTYEEFQDTIWNKYRHSPEETPVDIFNRVADAYYPEMKKIFFNDDGSLSYRVIPGGRVLYAAGKEGASPYNCSVLPSPEDSMEGIFETAKRMAVAFKSGLGVGMDISTLRPEGSKVKKGSAKYSTGAWSWSELFSTVTGIVGQCLKEDTLLYIKDKGLIKIKDVEIGDYVWTEKGWKKVTHKIKSGEKDVYKIVTKRGYEIEASEDHVFYDESGAPIKVKDMCVGQYIQMIRGSDGIDNIVKLKTPHTKYNNHKTNYYSYITSPSVLDDKLAYILGFYYGNGCIHKPKDGKYDYAIDFTISDKHPEIREKIKNIIKDEFNDDTRDTPCDGKCYGLSISRKHIHEFFVLNGFDKSLVMRVPKQIFQSNNNVRSSFVAGYFDADGYVSGKKKGYSFSSISEGFLKDIQLLLLSLGIVSMIHVERRDKIPNWNDLYTLTVTGSSSQRQFVDFIGQHSIKVQKKTFIAKRDNVLSLHRGVNGYPKKNFMSLGALEKYAPDLNSLLWLDEIKSISQSGDAVTYDITVEDTHKFFANGFYVSNSHRRGALLLSIDISHPDVRKFIHMKNELNSENKNFLSQLSILPEDENYEKYKYLISRHQVRYANISVRVTDDFMKAVLEDRDWTLSFTVHHDDGEDEVIEETVKARDLWNDIIDNMYESSEPGFLFIDTMQKNYILHDFEPIVTTNPCVTGDTWIMTSDGPKQVYDLVGKQFDAVVNGEIYKTTPEGFFYTGKKKVYKVTTIEGYEIRITGNHLVKKVNEVTRYKIYDGWVKVDDLHVGDKIIIHNHRRLDLKWHGKYTFNEGYVIGVLLGDGTYSDKEAILYSYTTDKAKSNSIIKNVEESISNFPHSNQFKGWRKEYSNRRILSMKYITDLSKKLKIFKNKTITKEIETASYEFYVGLIRGLFDTDGTVQADYEKKSYSIRLNQSNLYLLKGVQRMLLRLGIFSKIYKRRDEGYRYLPNHRNGSSLYYTKINYELVITSDNIQLFKDKVGFGIYEKSVKLDKIINAYSRKPVRTRFLSEVKSIEYIGEEDVYDVQVPGINAFDGNGFYLHNCGEISLSEWGVCNLISVNLVEHLDDEGNIDWQKLEETIRYAVRFADSLIDKAYYPFKEFEETSKRQRKIGLGLMGLADVFLLKQMRYGSDESVALSEEISKFFAKISFDESANLSKEFGAAPAIKNNFDKYDDMIEASEFLQQLVKEFPQIGKKIKKYGLRNSNLLSIAPTGTISLIAGVSSAFEPIFYFEMERWSDSFKKSVKFEHPAYTTLKDKGVINDGEKPNWLVSAADIDPMDKLRIHKALQKWFDLNISNTYTISRSASKKDIENLIIEAWRGGVKGITIYKEGTRGSIIRDASTKKEKSIDVSKLNYDRPQSLTARSYKYTHNDHNYYIIVAGERNTPLEIYLGSKNIKEQSYIIALNSIISTILKTTYVISKEYNMNIYRYILDKIIHELSEIKDSDIPYFYIGKRYYSPVSFWAFSLNYFKDNTTPDKEKEKRISIAVKQVNQLTKSDKKVFDFYPGGIDDEIPDDAVSVECPNCGSIIWTKREPFEFDCNEPCPNCGYSFKCE